MPSYSVVRCRPFCLAKASTSGVTVRVVPETKRITSLFSAASTSVLPHQPSPTMPALIITTNSSNQRVVQQKPMIHQVRARRGLRSADPSYHDLGPGQHGEDDAAQHPDHAILDAADHPDPLFSHLVGRGPGDEQ